MEERKLVTIVTEAALERELVRDLERLGVSGYTITEARGRGHRGKRSAAWEHNCNIHVEVVCDTALAQSVIEHLQATYYENYAMVMWLQDVHVLRPGKFK